jgi:hypothetical protein
MKRWTIVSVLPPRSRGDADYGAERASESDDRKPTDSAVCRQNDARKHVAAEVVRAENMLP